MKQSVGISFEGENLTYHLDIEAGLLWRGTERVDLEPRAWSILQYLVEHHGKLTTYDQLLEAGWGSEDERARRGKRSINQENVTQVVKDLRKALRDDASRPRFIENVPKRGYRFIAEVVATAGEPIASAQPSGQIAADAGLGNVGEPPVEKGAIAPTTLSVAWTNEGPSLSGRGTTISPSESTVLLDRYLDEYDDLVAIGTPREKARVMATLRACSETYGRSVTDAELKNLDSELGRKNQLFYEFLTKHGGRDVRNGPASSPSPSEDGADDYSRDDERVWLKFRCNAGHVSWQQLWEVKAFHEWLKDRRDIQKGMSLWAVCKAHGHGLDGTIDEVRIEAS